MNFKTYSRLNNIVGWIVFAVAAITYLLTIEHTVSLWDCGEFVSCDYKLEIPHPPGAPFYTLIYRLFAMVANPTYSPAATKLVPIFTNAASALSSAFTILFLFWSITALAIKVLVKDEENMDKGVIYAVLGSGIVGALAYTFSDTFWFSAVESEVYAMSSMFTALVFWLALKWERRADEPHNLRWLILIFYMVGLAIGVHLLGLLVIPAIVMIFYFKKYPNTTIGGALLAILISFIILAVVQYGIIIYMPAMASWFDLRFVNDFHLPFWSGVIFFYLVIMGVAGYFIYWSHKNRKLILNVSLISFVTVIIGFGSYTLSVIRSFANPPIDMNDPEDVFSLVGYLGREQYGDNYLVKGPYYTAYTDRAFNTEEGGTIWRREGDKYVKSGNKINYKFQESYETIFPRMFNGTQDNYIAGYRYWGDVKNEAKISFIHNNMRFFFAYQINYMYWRYFAWNFVGRQNDNQGTFNEFNQGNWMTGIPFIDEALGLGPQDHLPFYLTANKARNLLFALPFILGLLGFFYQYNKDRKDFLTVLLFFFMTGLAIEIYLNMPSPQPRERDYAFVGSFYVFAIWIGFGVMWLYDVLKKKTASVTAASLATVICLVAVPVLMAAQEWNDHDRSKRTASRDYGVDYLQSCAPHAVLFTNGDNDTYPLWYAQEVEGVRDDIRIINLSLFGTDWYINQMRRPINHAPALKFSLTADQTAGWDYLPYEASLVSNLDQTQYMDIFKVLQFIGSTDPGTKAQTYKGDMIPYMPTQKLRIPVDRQKVLRNGTVRPQDSAYVVDHIDVDLKKTAIMKSDIMVLDFIATNQFDVPIYFSITSGPDEYLNLGAFLQQEGLTYRLVPVKYPTGSGSDDRRIATDIMYNNVMNKFEWGKLDKGDTYVDYVLARQSSNMRGVMQTLARQLVMENQNDKAIKVVDKAMEMIPERNVPYDYYVSLLMDVYYRAGANDKGRALANRMYDLAVEELNYYSRLKPKDQAAVERETKQAINTLRIIMDDATQAKQTDLVNKVKPQLDNFTKRFEGV